MTNNSNPKQPKQPSVTYSGNVFNRRKLTAAQERKIALEAAQTARQDMVPDGGGISLFYDPVTDSWTAMYSVETPKGHVQIGFNSQARTAYGAVRQLEERNLPNPVAIQQAWNNQASHKH